MSQVDAQRPAGASLGYVLLLGAGAMLSLSFGIERVGIGSGSDPGPRFFPVILSGALVLAGAWEIRKKHRSKRDAPQAEMPANDAEKASRPLVSGVLALFVAYIIALPWLGFALSSLLLTTVMLRVLSVSWRTTGIVSIVLLLIVYLLFGLLFRVPLPTGVFGMPF